MSSSAPCPAAEQPQQEQQQEQQSEGKGVQARQTWTSSTKLTGYVKDAYITTRVAAGRNMLQTSATPQSKIQAAIQAEMDMPVPWDISPIKPHPACSGT